MGRMADLKSEIGMISCAWWQGLLDFIGELLGWDATTASAHPATAPALSGLACETQTIPSGVSQTVIEYTYDPLSRLTAADYNDGSYFHYTLNAVGNRTREATLAGETAYVYDEANRLVNVDGETYNWDANGNLTWIGSWTHPYFYDAANRLTGVGGMTLTAGYGYNGLGDRVLQVLASGSIQYTLDLAGGLTQVLAEDDHTYLYGNERIAQYSETATEYFLTDALGSVRQLVDGNGEMALAKSYKPYGEVLSSSDGATSAFGFTGEAQDGLTGFVYLRARYLDPVQGRFLSRDVWQGDDYQPVSYNMWLYTSANPINLIDPSGKYNEKIPPSGIVFVPRDALHSVDMYEGYEYRQRWDGEWVGRIADYNRPIPSGRRNGAQLDIRPGWDGLCGPISVAYILQHTTSGMSANLVIAEMHKKWGKPPNMIGDQILRFVNEDRIYSLAWKVSGGLITKWVPSPHGHWKSLSERNQLAMKIKYWLRKGDFIIPGVLINKSTGKVLPYGVVHWLVITGISENWDHSTFESRQNWVRVYNPFDNDTEYYRWNDFKLSWENDGNMMYLFENIGNLPPPPLQLECR